MRVSRCARSVTASGVEIVVVAGCKAADVETVARARGERIAYRMRPDGRVIRCAKCACGKLKTCASCERADRSARGVSTKTCSVHTPYKEKSQHGIR